MTDAQFEELVDRLGVLTRLAALSLIADRPQQDQILLLSKAGIQPKQIAEILGTTANTVSVSLSKHRKKSSRKK